MSNGPDRGTQTSYQLPKEHKLAEHSQVSAGGHVGTGKRHGVAGPWPGPQGRFPAPLTLTTVEPEQAGSRGGQPPSLVIVAKEVSRVNSKVGYPHEPCGTL